MFKRNRQNTSEVIEVEGITVEVTRKNIKNMYIRVYPGKGVVKLSGPGYLRQSIFQDFVISKIDWIKSQLHNNGKKENPIRIPKKFTDKEVHYVWGEEKELKIERAKSKQSVKLNPDGILCLKVHPESNRDIREKLIDDWYRKELKTVIPKLIEKYELIMGVEVNKFGVRKMKTRWGSCNIRAKRIWLNLELAKRDPVCLEMVVVHEMVHLLERLHSKKFYRYMDQFMPEWKKADRLLM